MTTTIVTGGAGYIGSHTCKALRVAGFVPVSYDNLERGNPEAVQWSDLELGDFADIQRLHATFARHRPAAIVHLAALAYVGVSNANRAAVAPRRCWTQCVNSVFAISFFRAVGPFTGLRRRFPFRKKTIARR